jgi:protoheme IX farnesyltransferase
MLTIPDLAGLIKYRLSLAVTFSAVTGYLISNPAAGFSLLLLGVGVFLLSSGSATLNQYTEREYDALMSRTRNRPLPLGKMKPASSLNTAVALIASGFLVLLLLRPLTAFLGLSTVVIYNIIYTGLKRVTLLAVIPGALVGAMPPIMGFTATGGTSLPPGIIFFAGFMFMWQMPHFWLILMKYRVDYEKAGFKSFSKKLSDNEVKVFIFVWVLISTTVLQIVTVTTTLLAREMNLLLVPLNVVFIFLFHNLLFRSPEKRSSSGAFILINVFSLAVMVIFIINSFLG